MDSCAVGVVDAGKPTIGVVEPLEHFLAFRWVHGYYYILVYTRLDSSRLVWHPRSATYALCADG